MFNKYQSQIEIFAVRVLRFSMVYDPVSEALNAAFPEGYSPVPAQPETKSSTTTDLVTGHPMLAGSQKRR